MSKLNKVTKFISVRITIADSEYSYSGNVNVTRDINVEIPTIAPIDEGLAWLIRNLISVVDAEYIVKLASFVEEEVDES